MSGRQLTEVDAVPLIPKDDVELERFDGADVKVSVVERPSHKLLIYPLVHIQFGPPNHACTRHRSIRTQA